MSQDRAPLEPLALVHTMPMVTRSLIGGFGLFALLVPGLDLGHWLFQPTLFVLPFWIITLGAAALGATMIIAAISGDETLLLVDG